MNVWVETLSVAADMTGNSFKKSKRIAVSALLAAISFVALYMGALTGVFDLCAVVVGALCVTFAKIEMGKWYPYLIAAVTFALSFLLLSDKIVAFEYLFLGGIYPILKYFAESLKGKVAEWAVKLVYFNAVLAVFFLLSKFVFISGEDTLFGGSFLVVAVVVLALNGFFVFYDYAMTRFISYYVYFLRKKLKIRDI